MSAPEPALAGALLRLADGYAGRGESCFTGADVADDLRALASSVDVPEAPLVERRALRRADWTVSHADCPRCGRKRGAPCASLNAALGEDPRDRVYPHREREFAARA